MRERSPHLKKLLTESLDSGHTMNAVEEELGATYTPDTRKERLWRHLGEESSRIEDFERRYENLLKQYTTMSDDDFDTTYCEMSAEFEDILARVTRYADDYKKDRAYTVEFMDMDQIESLDDFVKFFPLQFIPKKEDIGRVLALLKHMHETRVHRGEKGETDPLRVVDVGGANGAFGKLLIDLANENGLEIEYTVVDPDSPTVRASSKFYGNDPRFDFKEQSGYDFVAEQYRDNHDILNLLSERNSLIAEGERVRSDLQKVVEEINSLYGKPLSPETVKKYVQILRDDFGIAVPESLKDNSETFSAEFSDQYGEYGDEPLLAMQDWRNRIDSVTERLESLISREPAEYDLVINSWMPPGIDLTKEIREVNGAAIFYALECYGSTGCRSDAPYPQKLSYVGYDESYHPGGNYRSKIGWVSHSTPQVRTMKHQGRDNFFEYTDDLWVSPFSNGFVFQIKESYDTKDLTAHPTGAGIEVQGQYPWEKELTEKGGSISPIIELRDTDNKLDYFSPFGVWSRNR